MVKNLEVFMQEWNSRVNLDNLKSEKVLTEKIMHYLSCGFDLMFAVHRFGYYGYIQFDSESNGENIVSNDVNEAVEKMICDNDLTYVYLYGSNFLVNFARLKSDLESRGLSVLPEEDGIMYKVRVASRKLVPSSNLGA